MAKKHIRLVFADEGSFHTEIVTIDADQLDEYDRLIDLLREDTAVTRHIYIDLKRLVSASLADEES